MARTLASAALAEPTADAAVLVEGATGLDRSALWLGGSEPLGQEAAARLAGFVQRRLAGEPVFRILGRRPFWTLDLLVTPAVLDPRSDTETLVEAALRAVSPRRAEPLTVLDLGTGSGAILCAVLSECPAARGVGVDRSAEAAQVAVANLAACGLAGRGAVVVGDWAAALALPGGFDLVVSNPPYIVSSVIPTLSAEVRHHDPLLALDGGPDGLDAYRAITADLWRLLAPGGTAAVEVGFDQAAAVAALMAGAGLAEVAIRADLGGHERVVVGHRPGARQGPIRSEP